MTDFPKFPKDLNSQFHGKRGAQFSKDKEGQSSGSEGQQAAPEAEATAGAQHQSLPPDAIFNNLAASAALNRETLSVSQRISQFDRYLSTITKVINNEFPSLSAEASQALALRVADRLMSKT